jgi:hypothetical protein
LKQEYVKKEFIARAYESTTGVLEEVERSIVRNTRTKLQMRLSRPRREFGQEGFNFIDKDSAEFPVDFKSVTKNIVYIKSKKVLEIGLQAAHQMKRI